MSTQRIFITGLSALTASGNTLDETWQSLLAGQHGLAEISQWDLTSWPARLGGELKDFQPARQLPDRKLLKVISRQDAMGILAAHQAIAHSGMIPYRDTLQDPTDFNDNTGVYVGSPGNKYYQQYDFLPLLAKAKGNMQVFAEQLGDVVHPMWLLRILPNNVLAYTGIGHGFKGPNHNVTNHSVGGAQALLEAFHAIRSGQASRAVVVAYDVGIEPQALYYYDKLGVLSSRHLKPFDEDHDGTILAEGATALVLESEHSAKARQARCYAEMLGGLSATETQGLFSLDTSGNQLSKLMQRSLSTLAIPPEDIGMIVAHGNGNKHSDDSEAAAIRAVFAESTPVTGFKWSMGHTLAASGLLDTVLATKALQNNCIPGIASLQTIAEQCAPLSVSSAHRSLDKPTALLLNRGFASMNTCVVIKSCE